jgi:DeoR family suf operon transcriptional repressor
MGSVANASEGEHLPAAYRGPRGAILVELKRAQRLTARDLGQRLGLSPTAVRHHLKELEAAGLVFHRREQRGVGAPTYAYHLSPAGDALFPQRYKELLTDVLDRVVDRDGRPVVVSALEQRYADLAKKLAAELADAGPAQRLEAVRQALIEGGFMAEWEDHSGSVRLTEHNCAIRAVAERFPEVCAAEARFLQEVLAAAVQREAHILSGCGACEYRVHFPSPATREEHA